MKYKIDKQNYSTIDSLAKIAVESRSENLEIILAENLLDLPSFPELLESIYNLLNKYESKIKIILKNFPYCLVSSNSLDHIVFDNFSGDKGKSCKKCKWDKSCGGFPKGYLKYYRENGFSPILDLPTEVMIEIEPKCNLRCNFCFNKISFASCGREKSPRLGFEKTKKIIDDVYSSKIKTVRFTGGEPLLRKDIFKILKYAKNRGFDEVRLNTNGILVNKAMADNLAKLVDNILIPIENYLPQKEDIITGGKGVLKKKEISIKFLKESGIKTVRVGTVLTKENILNLENMADFIEKLPIDEWEFYRPIPISGENILDSKLVKVFVEKIFKIRKTLDMPIALANSLPFCAIKDTNKLSSISVGATADDGHSRIVVDPRGFYKPHYFIDENLGDTSSVLKVWKNKFLKKIRSLNYLPEECKKCFFVSKCKGGSRQASKVFYGDYFKKDPLANKKNL